VNQLALRGSTLVNSGNVIGAVVYTGEESKIRMNANEAPRSKAPLMESFTNKIV
jgi:phospholipid-translocating ATPase